MTQHREERGTEDLLAGGPDVGGIGDTADRPGSDIGDAAERPGGDIGDVAERPGGGDPNRPYPEEPSAREAASDAPVMPPAAGGGLPGPSLVAQESATELTSRWEQVQVRFVDEPRQAVAEADQLVADVMRSVAARFAEEKRSLETQWSSGGEVATEDLRQALQRYRAFFERLLAA